MGLMTIKYAQNARRLSIVPRNPLIDFFGLASQKAELRKTPELEEESDEQSESFTRLVLNLTVAEIDQFGQRLSVASKAQLTSVVDNLVAIAKNPSFRHQYLAATIVRHCPIQRRYVPQICAAAKVSSAVEKEVSKPISWISRLLSIITGRPPEKRWSNLISSVSPSIGLSLKTPKKQDRVIGAISAAPPIELALETPKRQGQDVEAIFATPSPSRLGSDALSPLSFVKGSPSFSSPAAVAGRDLTPATSGRKRKLSDSFDDDKVNAAIARLAQRRKVELMKAEGSVSASPVSSRSPVSSGVSVESPKSSHTPLSSATRLESPQSSHTPQASLTPVAVSEPVESPKYSSTPVSSSGPVASPKSSRTPELQSSSASRSGLGVFSSGSPKVSPVRKLFENGSNAMEVQSLVHHP